MTEANVEIVRRVYDAAAGRDSEAVLELYEPDAEYNFEASPFREVMERPVYHGHDGLREMFRERSEFWQTVEDECSELITIGDAVVSVVVSRGRGRASGAEVSRTHYGVWTFRNGRVARVLWMGSRAEALETASRAE
jgi:ketosteroid isomerase-like protein